MKPEQQRIAIAEACGWTVINDTLCNIKPDRYGDPEVEPIAPLPDYLNDLNAMQEAVMSLSNTKFNRWAQELSILLTGTKHKAPTREFLCATAAQRAEAFLRTLLLWTEEWIKIN